MDAYLTGAPDVSAYLKPAWRCAICGDVHPTEDIAHDCCDRVEETQAYICPCGELYYLAAPEGFAAHVAECERVNCP